MSPAMGAGLKFEPLHGSRGANLSPALGAAMGAGVQIWGPPWEPVSKFGSRHGSRDPNLGPAMGAGTEIWVPPWEPGPKFGFRP